MTGVFSEKKIRRFFISVAVLLAVLAAVAGDGAERRVRNNSAREKARYYYLEGLRHQVDGQRDAAYEYFGKASRIDTTYAEAFSAYGTYRLLSSIGRESFDSDIQASVSLDMMRKFVDLYPRDFFESSYYAYLALNLGDIDEAVRVFRRTYELNPERTAVLVHLADACMAAGDLDGAVDALNRYEKAEGMSSQLTLKKISYMLGSKDTVGSLAEIDRLVEAFPSNPSYLILKGNFYDVIDRPDSAFSYYRKAEDIAPENGAPKLALAQYYQSQGDSAAYDNKIYEALLSEDFSIEEKSGLMAEYLQKLINNKQDTQRGDYLFSVLRDQYPHDATVLDLYARYSAAKGDFKTACEQIEYAIDQNSENADYWAQLMSYQVSDDRPEDAINTFEKARSCLSPLSQGIRLLLAGAAQEAGDYDRATSEYTSLLQDVIPGLNPLDSLSDESLRRGLDYGSLVDVSGLLTMMGDNFFRSDSLDMAFRAYENALFFYPENGMAANNYAYFLAESGGDLRKAERLSKTAVDQSPDNVTFMDTYAWIQFKLGNYKEALTYQTAAIEKSENGGNDSAELLEHYGDILFMNGRPEEAVEYWEKALKLEPDKDLLRRKVRHKTYFYK